MSKSLDELFEDYWKSIQIAADDQTNWASEESRELNKQGHGLLEAFKFTIKRAFFAGYAAKP